MILNSPYITGSLTVTGNTTIQGQLTVTGSLSGTASLASNALLLQGTGSTGFATTSSVLEVSSSQQSISASLLEVSASYIALSGSYNTFSGSASTRITENSSSIQQVSASLLQVSASYIALSGSYNTFSGSASTRVTQIEQTYATTGSNSFRATQSITGSLTVTGQIVAQSINVQQVTSSIVFSSGSNLFGNALNNTQTMTGSVNITGSLALAGNITGNAIALTGALSGTSATFSGAVQGDFLVVGTTAATSGGVRLGTQVAIRARNVANNANIPLIESTATDAVAIASGGANVGIGTSSPLSLLHIASADTDQGIRLTRANGTFGIRITRTGQIQGKLSDDTTFQTAISLTEANTSGSQYLALQPTAGNVLIGTTTDNGYKLQVSAEMYATGYIVANSGGSIGAINSGAYISLFGTAQNILFGTNNAEKMRITSGGLVGIGTSSPNASYKLTLSGASSGVVAGLALVDTEAYSFSIYTGASALLFRDITNAAERMRITSGGLVGIGRTPTTNILEINGDASKTSAGSWLANSDINIKTDINTIQGALERINKVRLVSFKYKDEYKEVYTSIKDKYYQNVIAQEYQEIYPDYVYDSSEIFEEHNILQVDTNPMFVDSVSAIQELSKIVKEQQAQIEELKALIAAK